jgi:hypothetical protein
MSVADRRKIIRSAKIMANVLAGIRSFVANLNSLVVCYFGLQENSCF